MNWEKYIKIDPRYSRPETEDLAADSSKIKRALCWKPKVRFKDLVKIMVDADMRKAGLTPIGEGDEFLCKNFPYRCWKAD